jgi:DNA mismatch endonuclease (patch repair protein)
MKQKWSVETHHLTGRHLPFKVRQKLSRANKGKKKPPFTKEHIEKLRLAKVGRKLSLETRQKQSESHKGKIPKWKTGHPWTWGKPASEQRRARMREARKSWKIPFRDTKPERMLQIVLSLEGIQYQKHRQDIFGYPDILIEPNICIFVDGCYYHGCTKCNFKAYPKLREKMQRDVEVNHYLNSHGYHVIRIWEHEILSNNVNCAKSILSLIKPTSHQEVMP